MGNEAPIGVFDSGIGGLTVVKELRQLLPGENIIYVGDTARVPYGSRDPQEIIRFMHQILRFFAQQKVKMAVFACNTMTAYGYELAKGMYPFRLIPMNSAVPAAIAAGGSSRIGVIATEATVRNEMHRKSAAAIDPGVEICAKACPAFVPLIESGQIAGPEIEAAVRQYAGFFAGKGIGSLILGCTHYPLIAAILRKYLEENVQLVNPAEATALAAAEELKKARLLNENRGRGSLTMCFSADLGKARKMAELVLDKDTAEFKGIDLAQY